MIRLCHIKSLDKSLETLDPPAVGPVESPFSAVGPFLKDGEPAANAIVFGQGTDGKGHPSNAAYRRKILNNASEFKGNSDREGKRNVTIRVVEEFQRKVISFYGKRRKHGS